MGSEHVLPLRVIGYLGVMAVKDYSSFSKAPGLELIFVAASCLPPDRTWHKVNDPKVDYSGDLGEGKVGYEPSWTMLDYVLGLMWACSRSLALPSATLVTYPGNSLGCYPLQRCSQRILQPHSFGLQESRWSIKDK